MRLVGNTKLRKYEYNDNIELYRIDTRSFSQVPDISTSTNDRTGLNYIEIASFYTFIEDKLKEKYKDKGEYESFYAIHTETLIFSAYIQIYILRNGKKSRQNIVHLSEEIEK